MAPLKLQENARYEWLEEYKGTNQPGNTTEEELVELAKEISNISARPAFNAPATLGGAPGGATQGKSYLDGLDANANPF